MDATEGVVSRWTDPGGTFGSFEWEPETRRLSWSDHTCAILGVPRVLPASSELFRSALHPRDRARVIETLERLEATADGYVVRYRVVHPDGSVRHVHEQGARVTGASDGRRVFVGTLLDVTAEVGAVAEVARSQELLKRTLDSQIDPFALLESVRDESGALVDLRFVEANGAAAAYNLMSREELVGATMLELFPGLLEHGPLQAYFDAIETGEPMILDEVGYANEVLGEERRYDLRGYRVGDGLALTWRDVTDRFRSTAELARSEERYRLLAENASDFVLRTGPDGRIDWVSPSIARALGWQPDEVVGRELREFCAEDDVEQLLRSSAALNAGHQVSERLRLRTRRGDVRWFSQLTRPVRGESGEVQVRVGSWRDIQAEVEAEDARERSDTQYRLLAENAADVVFRGSSTNVLEWLSPSVRDLLGWEPEDMVGHPVAEFFLAEDLPRLRAAAAKVDSGSVVSYEARLLTRTEGYRWIGVTVRPFRDSSGAVRGRVGAWRDISDAVRAREALEQSERLFRTVVESSAIGVALVGLDGGLRVVNHALCDLLGRDESWMLAHRVRDLLHEDVALIAHRTGAELLSGERSTVVENVRLVAADGAVLWARASAVMVRMEEEDFFLVQVEDITAERAAREELAYHAFHDALTGLRNRAWILDILSVDLQQAKRRGHSVGVLFVDLDNFKVVNDSLGHHAGDEVLTMVAERLLSALRPGDRVGRFGGDEFVVVVPGIDSPNDAERVAERVSAAVSEPLVVRGHRILPTVSIGIAMSSETSTPSSLLRDTDAALFRAKANGRSRWHFFDDAMHAQALARLTLEDELRYALAREEFVVHYQPIVRLSDSSVQGHEALVRWQHPTRGLLAPGSFLDVAEESGLIVDIGAQVLDRVCAELVADSRLGEVSVNMSGVQLSDAGWLAGFRSCLARHAVDPARLVVEVTETAVLSLLDTSAQDFRALRDFGVGLHLDDFGTGFSSISLLQELPISGLKLDARFVRGLGAEDSAADALSTGLAGLVRGLHLTGVAEGIETASQAEILRLQGWELGQGYYFGRPQPQPVTSVVST